MRYQRLAPDNLPVAKRSEPNGKKNNAADSDLNQPHWLGGGGRTRTYDLWVMSPTSYHCSTPRCIVSAKVACFRAFVNRF